MSSNVTFLENHIQGNTQGGLAVWGVGVQAQITVSNNLIQGNTSAEALIFDLAAHSSQTTVVTTTAVGHPTLWASATDITRSSALIYLPLVLRGN